MILLIFAAFGFILLNISIGANLLSAGFPRLIVFMGMSFPAVVTIIVFLILAERIREVRLESSFNFSKLTLLAVESNIVYREILAAILGRTGMSIEYAENSKAAVSLFEHNPDKFNIIFMDVLLPEIDGFEAARAIRAIGCDRARDIPIIAMVAGESTEDIENSRAAGMNDHIKKPFVLDNLYFIIRKHALFPRKKETKQKWEQGIAWDESLSLGDEQVDAQHHQVFELISSLVSACSGGTDKAKVRETLDFMVNYAVQHFNDEEALMLRHNYPGFKVHKQLHEDFKITVGELAQKYSESSSSKELSDDVVRIVVRWLTSHIMEEDKKIVIHIRSKTIRN
jgi:hemerythrin-like metal-binding protein